MIFEDITLTWKGEEKVVKGTDVMRLIAKVESEITIADLMNNERPALAKLSLGYNAALNHAGFNVSAAEIYASLFNKESEINSISAITAGLLVIMVPPSTYQPQGKPQAKIQDGQEPSNSEA